MSNFKSQCIFVGPFSGVTTGQSICFRSLVNNFSGQCLLVDCNSQSKNISYKIYISVRSLLKAIFFIIFSRPTVIYISLYRTTFGFFLHAILMILSGIFNLRVIVHLHGMDLHALYKTSGFLFQKFMHFSFHYVDSFIILNDHMRGQLAWHHGDYTIEVVPNFYDPMFTNNTSYYKPSISLPFKFVYLSNIMSSKGILELIDAIKDVRLAGFDVELHIAGNFLSDHEMSADEMSSKFNLLLSSFVIYHGFLSLEEKIKLLSDSDVLVLPTRYNTEAFPLSIIEAMVSRCVVITSDLPILRDILPAQNFLLDSINKISLSFAIISVLHSDIPSIQESNYSYATNNFSLKIHLGHINRILFDD